MKWLVALFVVLIAAIWLGVQMHTDPGYVLIAYRNWSIETTLWMFFLVILLVFTLLLIISWVLRSADRLAFWARKWSKEYKTKHSQKLITKGLEKIAEGKWPEAEKSLRKAADCGENPLIAYLTAAKAAQHQTKYLARDKYLQEAYRVMPEAALAIGLTQAQLQLHAKQYEQALATLMHLREQAVKHKYVLQLLQRVYLAQQDWEELQQLLPLLSKYKVYSKQEIIDLARTVYMALLTAVKDKNRSRIQQLWQEIPKELRYDAELLDVYTKALIRSNDHVTAEKIIRQSMKHAWYSNLAYNYGLLTTNSDKQLAVATAWLKQHRNDINLLLTLGQLTRRLQLWGQAQNYLTQCVSLEPQNKTAYRELAQIMEVLGNKVAAYDYYRKACA